MPDITINVEVAGADQAASDLKDIGNAAKSTGGDIKSAGSDISSTTQSLSSFKSSLAGVVGSFTAISSGVLNLVRSFTQVEQAQVRLDTANRRVETSAQAVTKAQNAYNDAVQKYGANSKEAQAAADKLKTAIEGHNIAVDRANLQQQKFNETLASLATDVVPNVIGVFGSIVGAISSFTTKGEQGVSLAGKLKQSFLDLVSGGSNVKGALDTAGTAMGGLGTKAQAAGTSAAKLENEVVQLGAGVSQAVPGIGQFTGGITNTAAAAERTAGPLGNIERSVASTAAEVGGAVAPLGAFAGGMGATGTAAEGAVGGLEAAAASSGALGEGAVAATTATAGLETGILGISAATAAETAGISLAVAALVLYATNIGGFRDKTNAAIDSAQKFLAIGWDSFAKKFEPVTKAIEGAVKAFEDLIGKAGEAAKLNVSGQFGPQPAPGKALGPSGRPLDETIAAENAAMAKGTAGILNMVEAFKQLAEQRTQQEGLSKTGVANSNANAAAFNTETTSVTTLSAAEQQHIAAVKAQQAAEAERKVSIAAAMSAMQQVVNVTQDAATKAQQYSAALQTTSGQIQSNAQILGSAVGQQNLFNKGVDTMVLSLQNAQKGLIESKGELAALNANLQPAMITAYEQGWVDFNTTLDQTNITAAHTQGVFDAFISSLGTGKQQITDFNAGFTQGEAEIQKWATSVDQSKAALDGVKTALELVANQWGVELPKGIQLSNDQLQKWIGIIRGAPNELDALDKSASKAFQDVVKEVDKLREATGQKDMFKTLADNFQEQIQKFGGPLSQLTNKVAAEMSNMENVLNQGINRMGADLTAAKLTVGPIQTQSIQNARDDMNGMVSFLNQQFSGALRDIAPKFQPLINQIAAMGSKATTIQQLEAVMGLFKVAVEAAENPTSQTARAMLTAGAAAQGFKLQTDPLTGALKLVATNSQTAAGNVNTLGTNSSTASGNVDTFGSAVSTADGILNTFTTTLGTVGSFIQTFMESLPTNITAQLSGLGPAIQTAFTNAFTTAIGAVQTFLQTAFTSLSQNIPAWLAGLGPAINTAFTNAFTQAFSAIQSFLQTSFGSIAQNAGAWLAPLGPSVSTAFTNAFSQAFAAVQAFLQQGFGSIAQNAGAWLASLGPSVSNAFNNAFSQAFASVQAFLQQGFGSIAQNAGAWLAPLGASVSQAFTNAFTQAFSQVQSFLQQAFGSLAQNVPAWLGGLGSAVQTAFTNAFTQAFSAVQSFLQTSFQSLAQNVPSWLSGLGQAVTSVFQQAFGQGVSAATQAVQQGMQQIQNSVNNAMTQASNAVRNFTQALGQIPRQITINVTANTSQASQALQGLQNQINNLRATAPPGTLGFARRGGNFGISAGGFAPLKAQGGGAFIATHQMSFGNLTVGEGNQAELVAFHKDGRLSVDPLPFFNAQTGGVYGPLAGMGFTPGGFQQSGGQPQEYNIPAPVQTEGQGGPQQGMPSTEGAGTILVAPGGNAVTGPVTAPPGGGPGGGFGGLIPGAPSSGTYEIQPQTGLPQEFPAGTQAPVASGGIAQTGPAVPGVTMATGTGADVSPYEMAQMTGQAVADQQAPQQQQMQSDMSDILAAIRRLIAKISMRDINTNLVVDGQKMATTVSKYIGSNAYGGR